jgi:hypothetical protein
VIKDDLDRFIFDDQSVSVSQMNFYVFGEALINAQKDFETKTFTPFFGGNYFN